MKDFDSWNDKKKNIDIKTSLNYCRDRQVWWCCLGLNIGIEENGKGSSYERPVLILKNLSAQSALIVPFTTSKNTHPMRISTGTILKKETSVILSQLRVIDTRRISEKITTLDSEMFQKIKRAIREMLQ